MIIHKIVFIVGKNINHWLTGEDSNKNKHAMCEQIAQCAPHNSTKLQLVRG